MNRQTPEYTLKMIQNYKIYDKLYDPIDMKKEGELMDMDTMKLVQGIILADQEDQRFIRMTTETTQMG
ncbi:MAG: hypothetical protein ACTSUE_17345 [Promethearchaeota archaeon]